jgi:hypothetical protein
LAGCSGLFGGTTPFVLEVDAPSSDQLQYRVEVGAVRLGPRLNHVYAVDVDDFGGFKPKDRHVLKQSLQNTFAGISWPGHRPTWHVHVMVRRYVAAYNNKGGALLASVSWCLMNKDDQIVYEEQFYTSDSAGGLVTYGQAKDRLNKLIVRRVVETALVVASTGPPTKLVLIDSDNIYSSIDEAANYLPQSFPSMMAPNGRVEIDWTSVDPREPIEWGR